MKYSQAVHKAESEVLSFYEKKFVYPIILKCNLAFNNINVIRYSEKVYLKLFTLSNIEILKNNSGNNKIFIFSK